VRRIIPGPGDWARSPGGAGRGGRGRPERARRWQFVHANCRPARSAIVCAPGRARPRLASWPRISSLGGFTGHPPARHPGRECTFRW